MIISPPVADVTKHNFSPAHQSAYYFSRVPLPIELKPYYQAYQNYLFFLVLNNDVRISESDGVLIIDMVISVLGDFRLPQNYLIMDVSSNIGEFNNIPLTTIGIERHYIGQHEVKINKFLANLKINLNDVGYARKEVINKEITFEPQIHLNSNINNYEDQINFGNYPKSIVYDEIYNSMKNWNFKYIYKNVFDLKWTPSRMQEMNLELFSKPFLGFKFNVDDISKVIEVNQKIKSLYNLYAYEFNTSMKEFKEAQIHFELEYKSLFNNEPKTLKWIEDVNSIVPINNEYMLEIKNKFKYDFVKDELTINNVEGFNGIWLPNNGIFKLKTKIVANTRFGKQVFKNDVTISVIHNIFKINNGLHSKIKVKRAIIKNYEDFKNTKN